MTAFVPRPYEGAVRMTYVSVNPGGATGQARKACAPSRRFAAPSPGRLVPPPAALRHPPPEGEGIVAVGFTPAGQGQDNGTELEQDTYHSGWIRMNLFFG